MAEKGRPWRWEKSHPDTQRVGIEGKNAPPSRHDTTPEGHKPFREPKGSRSEQPSDKPRQTDAEILGRVLKDYAQDEKSHAAYCKKVEDWYKTYRGVLEVRSRAANWTSRQHPPYVHQVIETMIASAVDPDPSWRVKPRPRHDSPENVERLRAGAQANEWLLSEQADCDHLGEKQALFAKQMLIAGLSVYKTGWDFQEVPRRRQAMVQKEIIDEHDTLLGHQNVLGTETYTHVAKDDNFAEVVDVRDFIWHEAAVSLDKAKRVTHRVLYTMEEMRQFEALGVYKNVDQLSDTEANETAYSSREQELFETDRSKDMIEVLEMWRKTEDGMRVTSIGNRSVVLRDKPNPFWHGQYPFVVCSSVPDLFRIPGISEVELIRDLQEILWEFLNQRLDSTRLLNNAIVLIRDDADDYEQFEWAPGAQWIVQDPAQVSLLPITPVPAEISLQAEERLKQDLQNIPGANPALLGQMDQAGTTATEISVTTSLGQRRIAMKKQQMKYAHARLGEQWMANNQQFVTEDRLVAVVGRGGAEDFKQVSPLMIQGDYVIDLEALDESLIAQQRVAEAQSTFQVAAQAAGIFAPLSQAPGSQTPMLNMKAFMDDILEAKGISDKERYYLARPEQAQLQPPGTPSSNGNGNGAGVTAPQASDMQSVSHEATMSPASQMQQLLAQGGGPSNAPVG